MLRSLLLLTLLAVGLTGCDLFDLLSNDADEAYMDRLDGTWTLARYEVIRLYPDGRTVTELDLTNAGTFVFAETVRCPDTGFMLDGGDLFARAYTYQGDDRVVVPNMSAHCGIVFSDDPALRINFIATFGGDVLMTIQENEDDRQVWSSYALRESEGYYRRTLYTLTR